MLCRVIPLLRASGVSGPVTAMKSQSGAGYGLTMRQGSDGATSLAVVAVLARTSPSGSRPGGPGCRVRPRGFPRRPARFPRARSRSAAGAPGSPLSPRIGCSPWSERCVKTRLTMLQGLYVSASARRRRLPSSGYLRRARYAGPHSVLSQYETVFRVGGATLERGTGAFVVRPHTNADVGGWG